MIVVNGDGILFHFRDVLKLLWVPELWVPPVPSRANNILCHSHFTGSQSMSAELAGTAATHQARNVPVTAFQSVAFKGLKNNSGYNQDINMRLFIKQI